MSLQRGPGPPAAPASGWEAGALLALTFLLLGFGLISVYSSSSFLAMEQGLTDTYYLSRQGTGVAVGFLALIACALVPPSLWRLLAGPALLVTAVALTLLVLPQTEAIAPEINGARRWLRMGFTIQPSEFAKIAVVLWTAAAVARKAPRLRSLSRGLLPLLVVWSLLAALIALEPDLSTALLVASLGVMVAFVGGARIAHFVLLGLLALPPVLSQLRVGFRAERIAVFLDPASDPAGAGYQVQQSLLAAGSGGLFGVGFGEGRQKLGFLPEAHNDFIFALIAEEWGLAGVLLLVAAYLGIAVIGFRIAGRAKTAFEELMVTGLVAMIVVHAVLHMAVGLGLVPATGLSLPLVSYGRSNLLVTLAAIGMVVAVARASAAGEASRSVVSRRVRTRFSRSRRSGSAGGRGRVRA